MSEITPNNCRICLSPETIEEFKEINEISFNGGITALDALNEMFVLKVSKHELLTKEMPYKICQRCSKNLEIAVDLWSLAWDSQWILEEWKRSFSVSKNSSSTSSSPSPPPRDTPGDSGVEFSSLPITSNIMSYCQNVQPNVVGMFPCNKCSSTFALKASLKHHLKQNRNCSQQCKQIPEEKPNLKKKSPIESIYKTPIKIEPQEVNDSPPPSLSNHANFECNECPKSFPSKEMLQEHKRNRHLNRLKCKNCDKTFRYNKKLERHFKRRHASQQVEPVPDHLNEDETDFVPKKKIKLEKGQQDLVGLNFDQEARVVKKNLKKELQVEPIVDHENAFPCQMCTKSFSKKAYLVNHMRYHKNSKNSQVKVSVELNSQKVEGGSENLKEEEEEKERKLAEYLIKVTKNEEGKYKCMVEGCSLASSFKANLQRHIRIHLNIQKYKCSVCQRRYSSNADLNHHMKIHTKEENRNEKELKIKVNTTKEQRPILNPLKASKGSLKEKNLEEKVQDYVKNVKRNKETNAFTCSECPFETFSKTSLLNHINRHYNLRPYQCDICSRKFTIYATLYEHRQTHNTTKEYECPFCHEKCSTQRTLYNHRRVKHPNQSLMSVKAPKYQTNDEKEIAEYCRTVQRNEKGRFPCGMCNKDLVNKTNLKIHLKSHYRRLQKKEAKASQNDHFAGEDEIKDELMKAMQKISSATESEPSDDDDIWNISSDSDNEGTVIDFPMI